MTFSFEKDSTEEKITNLYKTMEAQKEANRLFKKADKELHEKTKTTIENLNDDQVKDSCWERNCRYDLCSSFT